MKEYRKEMKKKNDRAECKVISRQPQKVSGVSWKCLCHGFQRPRRPAACQTGGVSGGRGQGRNSTAVLVLDLERQDGNAGTLNYVLPLRRSRQQLSETHIHLSENTFLKKTHKVSGSKLWEISLTSVLMVALKATLFSWLEGAVEDKAKEEGGRWVGFEASAM